MATYCYFDIKKINNELAMQQYREKVLATVNQFGGKYLIIGGPFESKEGNPNVVFPVMIEFPDFEKAQNWYSSPDYAHLKELRLSAVESEAVFFQGL